MSDFELGYYRHFKGTVYYVSGLAKHSETQEEMVVYFDPDWDKPRAQMFVRPLRMFQEAVIWPDGVIRPRFVKVGEDEWLG